MHESTNIADRRVKKTIASLRSALIELILEKHYDSISVQDIIDRADVGRSTFYSHFRDKEDLLIGDWKKFLGLLAAHIDLDPVAAKLAPVDGLMHHLKDFHAFYRALVRSGKSDRLFSLGTEFLAEKIEEKIKTQDFAKMSVPPAVCSHYLALQIFGLLQWWLDRNMPYTPEEMDRMFHDLVSPGIRQIFMVKADSQAASQSQ